MNQKIKSLLLGFLLVSCLTACAPQQERPVVTYPSIPLSDIQGMNPRVLKLAIEAYNNAVCEGKVKHTYLTIVDFSKPSDDKRFWVIDMRHQRVLFYTYVSHGKNSGSQEYAHRFSNKMNSLESSLGVIETGSAFMGSEGYSMRLYGLEPGINDNIYERYIVMHSANYASQSFVQKYGYAGETWGCLAVDPALIKPIVNTIKDGSIIVNYYPDRTWIHRSAFLNDKFCRGM
jgi:hypothetical protein